MESYAGMLGNTQQEEKIQGYEKHNGILQWGKRDGVYLPGQNGPVGMDGPGIR